MKPSDYHDMGQYLRESRESLQVTLPEAAAQLHIRVKYLEALESGNLEELPGKSYTRGYIRNYAHYLRLDAEQVLESYTSLLGPKVSELFIPESAQRQNLPTNWLLWLSLLGLALIYACWYFTVHDRSVIGLKVDEVPPALAHLLDKTPPPVMDRAWQDCLEGADSECFRRLRYQALLPETLVEHDIEPSDLAPQKP